MQRLCVLVLISVLLMAEFLDKSEGFSPSNRRHNNPSANRRREVSSNRRREVSSNRRREVASNRRRAHNNATWENLGDEVPVATEVYKPDK